MQKREIKEKLHKLKAETAAEIGMTQAVKEKNGYHNSKDYKGDIAAKINGSQGGAIGGQMVKKMIRAEEEKMADKDDTLSSKKPEEGIEGIYDGPVMTTSEILDFSQGADSGSDKR